MTINSVAAELECDQIEAARRLQPAGALYFLMDEDDVRRVLRHPLTMIGSDGLPFDGQPHPRLWDTFPRVLGRYVRDSGILTLEAAIHKMQEKAAAANAKQQDRAAAAPGDDWEVVGSGAKKGTGAGGVVDEKRVKTFKVYS